MVARGGVMEWGAKGMKRVGRYKLPATQYVVGVQCAAWRLQLIILNCILKAAKRVILKVLITRYNHFVTMYSDRY